MIESSFMTSFRDICIQIWGLFRSDIDFPEPIGDISPLEIMMFFAVAYLLADTVSLIASRRD